jgi:hypothetical protein
MNVTEFALSLISVAPAALVDYAAIALILKLPLGLRFVWAARGFPAALVLMAALHTWQRPLEISGAVCLGCLLAARLLQAATLWLSGLRPASALLGRRLA